MTSQSEPNSNPTAASPTEEVQKKEEKKRLTYTVREVSSSDPDDVDTVSWVLSKAFLDDRVMNYFGGLKVCPTTREDPKGRTIYLFYKFLITAALTQGGRLTVATTTEKEIPSDPRSKLKNGETIAGVSCWYPPHKRLPVFNVPLMLRCGIWKVLKRWGVRGLMRSAVEYSGLTEKTHKATFKTHAKSQKESRVKGLTPEDAWYLQVVMTVKEFEGQGVLSLLVRDAYQHSKKTIPGPFILEATSERSRDRYEHLGYKLESDQPKTVLGPGKVDNIGLAVRKGSTTKDSMKGGKAEGTEYWCMVNIFRQTTF
ncbi:hypothetical protein K435DRAFT_841036 [Dendrothele bispora CBS 962.96]|uniref:N-acetyltransferase domain-containing protein n=1 Tax=Dendrothele bispora (strain CBS 962.96) TaxID=1314807 RepID=A0A4S8LQK7_DENBC|nr:hypothetical protein K435DRAFT_841036 [Dendrothele bispora CBS 962.96]